MIPEQRKLNIGCGYRKKEGLWNVDIDPRVNPDQILDLSQTPWPYEDDFFEKIHAENSLNFIGKTPEEFESVMKELYRVSAPGAEWYVTSPHPRSDEALDDYRQARIITPKTLMMFDQKKNFESTAKKTGECCYGFDLNIDVEIKDMTYNLLPYWQEQIKNGMIGGTEMEIKIMHQNNTIGHLQFFLVVHKPQRFADWYNQTKK